MIRRRLVVACLFLFGTAGGAQQIAPTRGSLVIVGGAMSEPAIVKRFIDLAGGLDAPIVVIPTAAEGDDEYDQY